jgi:glycosyltransferase involved in cell wall biosynthesis
MTSPFPDFPLPVKVADLEIADSVPPLGGCEAYGSVQLLLRRRGRPLGWVSLRGGRATIPPAEIERAMHRRLRGWNGRAAIADALPSRPPAPRPPISVVVCTRERPDLLKRCLHALSRLEYPHFEIVVVDNAPTTGETERVAAAAGVRHVVEPCPGLDWARKRGLAAARYDIIAFTDDDTEVDPHWLTAIAEAFQDTEVGGVTGFVMPGALDTEAEVLFELCYGGMGKGMMPREWDPAAMSDFERIGAHHVGVGANMAFRRGLLEQLGGFDTALDVGTPSHGGGDLDIFHRALMAGAVVRYQPAAILRHYHRSEMAGLRRQHYDSGRAFGVYLLTILRRGDIPRRTTLWYSIRVWLSWLVGRVIRRFRRRELLPMPLLLAELWGAAHAPWAYLATQRSDRARRKTGQM